MAAGREVYKNRIATYADHPYAWSGGLIPDQDQTILTRGRGRRYKLYLEDVKRDLHAFAVLEKRKMAVIARPWRVESVSQSERDVAVAAMVEKQLKNLNMTDVYVGFAGFDGLCYNLLEATLVGRVPAVVDWEVRGEEVVAVGVRSLDPDRVDDWLEGEFPELRILTNTNPVKGEIPPPRSLFAHVYGATELNPKGLGQGTRLWWAVFFKKNGIKFWLDYNERFASPLPKGTYRSGATEEEIATLEKALQQIAQGYGISIPEGMAIELLEAKRAGSFETHESLCRYMDEQMSECVLGETGTTNQSGNGGSRARDQVGNEVRLEIAQADWDLLSATLHRSLVRWIVELNAPGAEIPQVIRDFSEPEDLLSRSERDKNLSETGWELTEQEVAKVYGAGYQRKQSATQPGPRPEQFARRPFPDQVALDQAIGSLTPEQLQSQIEPIVKPMIDLIMGASSYEELLEDLAIAYPQMDDKQLEEALTRAIFAAETWGRLNP